MRGAGDCMGLVGTVLLSRCDIVGGGELVFGQVRCGLTEEE